MVISGSLYKIIGKQESLSLRCEVNWQRGNWVLLTRLATQGSLVPDEKNHIDPGVGASYFSDFECILSWEGWFQAKLVSCGPIILPPTHIFPFSEFSPSGLGGPQWPKTMPNKRRITTHRFLYTRISQSWHCCHLQDTSLLGGWTSCPL